MTAVIALVAAISLCASCSRGEPQNQTPAASAKRSQDPETAKRMIAAGATVIDVRTADEFKGGHVTSAANIPVDEVATRLAEVDKLVGGDKSKPIVVYCARGSRAAKAKLTLEEAGYQRVVNGGGLDDLQ